MHGKTVHDTTPHFVKCQRQLLLTSKKMWGWSVSVVRLKKTSHVYNHPPSGGGYRHDNCIFSKLNIKKYTTPRRGVVYFENGVLLFVV